MWTIQEYSRKELFSFRKFEIKKIEQKDLLILELVKLVEVSPKTSIKKFFNRRFELISFKSLNSERRWSY